MHFLIKWIDQVISIIKYMVETSQKIGSREFWQIAISVLNKGKSVIPSLFNDL